MSDGSARAEILMRIRRGLVDRPDHTEIVRDYRQAGTTGAVDLGGLFEQRLLDYRAAVRRCTPAMVRQSIEAALAARGATRVVVPEGFPVEWWGQCIGDDPPLRADLLDRLDGVVTTCALGIAETGTIALDHGAGQGRRALTLVPDYHLVVVRAEQIVHSVPDAIAALDPRSPMTWISGPSATSDIELQRVEGVHGPRHLEVLLVG